MLHDRTHSHVRWEDGKAFEVVTVPDDEIQAIIRRNADMARAQKGKDNQAAGSWHPRHVDQACQTLKLGGMPRTAEDKARVVRWLSTKYPYGVINASNLTKWRA